MFRSLRNRPFRLLLAVNTVAFIGNWMQMTAQDWLVLELTHGNGAAVGVTAGLQMLPLLFSMHASLLADRYAKRRVLMISQTVMGVFALVLGLLTVTGGVRVWHVYALALGLGLATAVRRPTSMAFVPEVVGGDEKEVSNAVALTDAVSNIAKMLGPALAGVLIAVVGTGWVLLINAVLFCVLQLGLSLMREDELFRPKRVPRKRGQLREALRYVRGRRDLVTVMITILLVSAFAMNHAVTNALMSREVFHTEASSFGLVTAALAGGGLIGSLLAAHRRGPSVRVMLTAAAAFASLVTLSGLMPVYWAFAVVQIPTGIALLLFASTALSLTQLGVSGEMRGRVMGLYVLMITASASIGYPLVGWLSELYGPRSPLIVGGLAALASVACVVAALARTRAKPTARGTEPEPGETA